MAAKPLLAAASSQANRALIPRIELPAIRKTPVPLEDAAATLLKST
jgi:hypothetical protein